MPPRRDRGVAARGPGAHGTATAMATAERQRPLRAPGELPGVVAPDVRRGDHPALHAALQLQGLGHRPGADEQRLDRRPGAHAVARRGDRGGHRPRPRRHGARTPGSATRCTAAARCSSPAWPTRVKARGGAFALNRTLVQVDPRRKRATFRVEEPGRTAARLETVGYDTLYPSVPLPDLIRAIDGAPEAVRRAAEAPAEHGRRLREPGDQPREGHGEALDLLPRGAGQVHLPAHLRAVERLAPHGPAGPQRPDLRDQPQQVQAAAGARQAGPDRRLRGRAEADRPLARGGRGRLRAGAGHAARLHPVHARAGRRTWTSSTPTCTAWTSTRSAGSASGSTSTRTAPSSRPSGWSNGAGGRAARPPTRPDGAQRLAPRNRLPRRERLRSLTGSSGPGPPGRRARAGGCRARRRRAVAIAARRPPRSLRSRPWPDSGEWRLRPATIMSRASTTGPPPAAGAVGGGRMLRRPRGRRLLRPAGPQRPRGPARRPRPDRRARASAPSATRSSGSGPPRTGPSGPTGPGPTSGSGGSATWGSGRSSAWSTTAAAPARPASSTRRSPTGWPPSPAAVARRYPWVEDYTPVNEPLTTARFSGLYGHWYPHGRDDRTFARALLNQCRAVVLAMRAIRAVNPAARLVQTEDLGRTYSTPRAGLPGGLRERAPLADVRPALRPGRARPSAVGLPAMGGRRGAATWAGSSTTPARRTSSGSTTT